METTHATGGTRRTTSKPPAWPALATALAAVLAASAAMAQQEAPPPDALRSPWPASWITCPGAIPRGSGVYHFRKHVGLDAVPAHYWVRVSADNRFVLLVNGARVGDGPARADLDHWRYETFDLAPYLRAGDNLLAATVWNYGVLAPVAQMSDQTAFLVNGDSARESAVNTDGSWEAKPEAGQAFTPVDGAKVPGYYAASPGERLDGALYDWDWQASTDGWKPAAPVGPGEPGRFPVAVPFGTGSGLSRWQLVPDPLPPMEFSEIPIGRIARVEGLVGVERLPVTVPAHTRVSLLIDRETMTTAFPELTTNGGAGSTVRLTYAEALVDDQGRKGDRSAIAQRHIIGLSDTFLPDGGAGRVWTTLGWRAWRFLQIDVETTGSPLTLAALRAHFTGYPFRERGRVEGSDPVIARIWETGSRTARMNAHETYSDCPYYEQLQYIGDTRLQALVSYVTFGDDRLAVQALDSYDASRSAEGLTQSRYPSTLPQFIPPFSLLWVGMLHDYWLYRPDHGHLPDWVAHTRLVIAWHARHLRPDGLLGVMPWWNYGDWTTDFDFGVPPQDADGGSALLSLGFVAALRDAADLEEHFGDPRLAAGYRSQADATAAAVTRLCWDGIRGLLADTPARQHYSEQTNTMGVLLDAIPDGRAQEVMHTVLDHGRAIKRGMPKGEFSPASLYFRYYVARAMDHVGLADRYLVSLGPWIAMLDLNLTTWAETAEPTRSDDHAWSAHPNYDLQTLVAGIRPASPGFATVEIAPHLSSLTELRAQMPHPRGDIVVHYVKSGARWTFDVTLPPGLSGHFLWDGRSTPLVEGANHLRSGGP